MSETTPPKLRPDSETRGPAPAIRPDARICAIGMTGTGKSTVLRWLFATQFGPRSGHVQRVLIDPQDTYELVPERGTWQGRGADAIDWRAPLIRVVPRAGDPDDWATLYRALNQRERVCTWLDEAVMAPRTGTRQAAPLVEYQTTGRKYRRAHLVASQYPVRVEPSLIDQADHLLAFTVRRPDDVKRLAAVIGMEGGERQLRDLYRQLPPSDDGRPSHGFVWFRSGAESWELRAPLPPDALRAADALVRALR